MGQGFFPAILNALAEVGANEPKKDGRINDIIDGSNKILTIILKLSILFLFAAFIIYPLVSFMLQKDDGLNIYPFETNGMPNLDGKYLSNLLLYDLHSFNDLSEKLAEIYSQRNASSNLYRISSNNPRTNPWDNTPDKEDLMKPLMSHQYFAIPSISITSGFNNKMLSQLGTVNFEGASISLGNVVLLSRQISGGSFLNCSIQEYGPSIILIGILDDHDHSNKEISVWQVNRTLNESNLSVEELVPLMIRDLAFQIDYETGRKDQRKNREYPQSWQTFKSIMEGNEDYLEFLSTKNSAYLDRARKSALEAKHNEPTCNESSNILLNIGIAYFDLGKYGISKEVFQDIGDTRPLESALGQGSAESMLGNYSQALDSFSKAALQNPDSYDAWYNKGLILQYLARDKEAIIAYDNALKCIEKNGDPSQKSRALVKKGNAFASDHNYKRALDEYRNANKTSDGKNAEAHFGIALASYLEGKKESDATSYNFYREAEAEYDKAISLNRLDAEFYNGKGNALFAQNNRTNESLQEYENAIILDPNMARAYNGKGNALEKLTKYNEARDAFMRAGQIDPSTRTYQDNLKKINATIEGLSNISDHAHP